MPHSDPSETTTYLQAIAGARGSILAFAAGCALAAAVLVPLHPRSYTARVVFLPSEQAKRKPPPGMMAMAASLGMTLPTSASGGSDLFPVLLRSDRLLAPMLDEPFTRDANSSPRPLRDWLADPPDLARTEAERRAEALERLRDDVVRAQRDDESELVTLQVTTESPALSAAIANRLTQELESYLVGARRDRGHHSRAFLTTRRVEVAAALAAAEQRLAGFRETNRRGDSPALRMEQDRLVRERNLRRQLLVELRKREEMARLAETRDTPVARVLEYATAPVVDTFPSGAAMILLAATLGLVLPVAGVLVRTAAVRR